MSRLVDSGGQGYQLLKGPDPVAGSIRNRHNFFGWSLRLALGDLLARLWMALLPQSARSNDNEQVSYCCTDGARKDKRS